jgi:pimeloyl-ACP methyl ester carboxylesterase
MDVSTFISHRQTVATASGEIAYTEWGSETPVGPAAVFVHGVGTSGVLWRNAIERLSDTTRCIAVDLPAHGGSPARADPSARAMAEAIIDLCAALGLEQVDLVGNDTGGAVAQLVAIQRPDALRSFTLTNCDTEGNFPPESFAPTVQAAQRGQLAPLLTVLAANPATAAQSPLGVGYEHPELVPGDVWSAYLEPIGGDMERARQFERVVAAIDPGQMKGVKDSLRDLHVPTLLVWGTADEFFSLAEAYELRDLIPGAREVAEIPGGKLFFPEEHPDELAAHLRRHWAR